MWNRLPLQRPLFVVPAFLLALVVVVVPAAELSAQANGKAYISFFGTGEVGVFDPATRSIVATVDVGGNPNGLAVTADGKYVYVVNTDDGILPNDAISVIDTATNTLVSVGFPAAWVGPLEGVATSPDGNFVYITYRNNSRLRIIDASAADAANHTVYADIFVQRKPNSVTVAEVAGTNFAYVANSHPLDNSVSVVNTATKSVVATLALGDSPQSLVAAVDGTRVFVTKANGTVASIDTSNNTWITTPLIGADSFGVALNYAGDRAYILLPTSNELVILDTDPITWETNPEIDRIPIGPGPWGAALRPDGSELVVTNFGAGNSVTVIDAAIPVGLVVNLLQGQVRPRYVAFEPLLAPPPPPPPPDAPPTLDSDACGTTINAELGEKITFMIDARDDVLMTLSVDGLPGSATMAPELSKSGDHVNSKFSWTPAGGDAGTYLITFAADDGVNPAASCAVTIVVPEPPEPGDAEFARFRLSVAKIGRRGRFADSFWFNGNFSADLENGNDIDPVGEDVKITIEGTEWTIPAGAFRSRWRGRMFRFRGTIGGTRLLVYITRRGRQGSGRYNINVSGWKGTFSDPQNPLEMCVTIGDDFGCAEAKRGWIR